MPLWWKKFGGAGGDLAEFCGKSIDCGHRYLNKWIHYIVISYSSFTGYRE